MNFEYFRIYHAKTKKGLEVRADLIGRNLEWHLFVLAALREKDKDFVGQFVNIGEDCIAEEVLPKNMPLYVSWFTCPEYSRLLRDS